MRITRGIAAVFLISLLVVAACSKDKKTIPVAKVGDRVISLDLFEKTFNSVDPKYRPESTELDGLKEFLKTMINREVLAEKADELGYDKDPYVVQAMEAFKKMSLQAGYLKFMVADKIKVTDKALREMYEKYGTTYEVKQILVDTKEEADEVYNLLKQGSDFESVCRQYSKGPDADEGGRVVSATYGMFRPEFNDELFNTPVGGITKPILSQYGYFVIKVVGVAPYTRKPFEEARSSIEQLYVAQQQMRLTDQLSEEMRKKANFQWYDDNIMTAFQLLPPDRPLDNPPDRNQEVYPILHIDPQDLEKPLVSYKNKVITMKDFSDRYDRTSFFERPRREFRLGGIKSFLIEVVMNELVGDAMASSDIENHPEVADLLKRKREQFMIEKLYQDLIEKETQVNNDEMQQYYNDNVEQFRRPEQRRFGYIVTGDKDTADEAYQALRAGQSWDRVHDRFNVKNEYNMDDPSERFVKKGEVAELDDHGFTLEKVGDYSEPYQTSNGWTLVKLLERQPERILSFQEAQPDVTRYLKSIKNEKKLNDLLDKWRSEISITVYDNNLKKAELQTEPKKGFDWR
jgi:parvulin-like peptidyl-prolyl isomerase